MDLQLNGKVALIMEAAAASAAASRSDLQKPAAPMSYRARQAAPR